MSCMLLYIGYYYVNVKTFKLLSLILCKKAWTEYK